MCLYLSVGVCVSSIYVPRLWLSLPDSFFQPREKMHCDACRVLASKSLAAVDVAVAVVAVAVLCDTVNTSKTTSTVLFSSLFSRAGLK